MEVYRTVEQEGVGDLQCPVCGLQARVIRRERLRVRSDGDGEYVTDGFLVRCPCQRATSWHSSQRAAIDAFKATPAADTEEPSNVQERLETLEGQFQETGLWLERLANWLITHDGRLDDIEGKLAAIPLSTRCGHWKDEEDAE
jgi:hypothetical protein